MEERVEDRLRAEPIGRILSRSGVRMAFLFGSHAHGQATATSDVDLALAFGPTEGPVERLDRACEIGRTLRPLLGREVDVVVLDEAGPVLQFEAVIRGIAVFFDDAERLLCHENRVRTRYADYRRIQDHYTVAMRARLGMPS